ncbi:MAG: nitroreductase family protein [Candidatus Helarchaeota archaeon]|nr:nitroreductase family protein [Candidatus Helarchaeota archaeon]
MSKLETDLGHFTNSKLEVDLDLCTKCGSCVRECPLRLYHVRGEKLVVSRAADILCMECGHCVAVCPVNAIKLKKFPLDQVIEISKDFKIPSYDSLMNSIMARRSVRQFKKDPVPEDLWNKLLEAGRYSPTGHNDQLVHFTIVRNQERLKQFSDEVTQGFIDLVALYKDKSKFKEFKKTIPKPALNILKDLIIPGFPIMLKGMEQGEDFWRWNGELIIIHASKKTTTLIEDCSIAASHIMLAAKLLGLGTCSLGIATFALNVVENVKKLVNLPKHHIVGYTLAVGIPQVKYYRIPPRQPAKVTWL